MSASTMKLNSRPTLHHQSQCIAIDLSKSNKKSSSNGENKDTEELKNENDEFYFSNMLRSMVSTNNSNCSLNVGLSSWPSALAYTIDPFISKKLNLTTWPITSPVSNVQSWFNYVGDWNRPSSSLERTSSKNIRVNHPKKRKMEKKIGGKINQLKLHHSSAFKTPTIASRNFQNNSKSANSNAINIRYIMSNIGKIYSLTKSDVAMDSNKSCASSKKTANCEDTVKPPCKRFSALIGLEIVVDYVKRNDK